MKDLLIEIDRLADECATKNKCPIAQSQFMEILRQYSMIKQQLEQAESEVCELWEALKADTYNATSAKSNSQRIRWRMKMVASEAVETVARCDGLWELLDAEVYGSDGGGKENE